MEEFDLQPLLQGEKYIVCRQYDLFSALILQHYCAWMYQIFERLKVWMHSDFYTDTAPKSIQVTISLDKIPILKVVTEKFTYTAENVPINEVVKLLYCMYCVHSLENGGMRVLSTVAEQEHFLRHLFGDQIPVRSPTAQATFVVSVNQDPYTIVEDGPYRYKLEYVKPLDTILELPLSSGSALPKLLLQ